MNKKLEHLEEAFSPPPLSIADLCVKGFLKDFQRLAKRHNALHSESPRFLSITVNGLPLVRREEEQMLRGLKKM